MNCVAAAFAWSRTMFDRATTVAGSKWIHGLAPSVPASPVAVDVAEPLVEPDPVLDVVDVAVVVMVVDVVTFPPSGSVLVLVTTVVPV
jgi:hypothetical protein